MQITIATAPRFSLPLPASNRDKNDPVDVVSIGAPPPLLEVPDTVQSTNYSCGAGALRAVLGYYGKDLSEEELMQRLGTHPEHGTHPEALVRVSRELGVQAELRQHCTLEDLQRALELRQPVIVDAQAWRDEHEKGLPWTDVWESGHYMVLVGMDDQFIYLEDPSIEWSKGVIPRQEFLDRWHDYEIGSTGQRVEFHHAAIFFDGPPAPPPQFLRVD